MSVRIEKQGPVTTVILSRPQARNAVDPQTASALAGAFRDFEADPEADVAVLWGVGGNFCAGAALKARAEGSYDKVLASVGRHAAYSTFLTEHAGDYCIQRYHDVG